MKRIIKELLDSIIESKASTVNVYRGTLTDELKNELNSMQQYKEKAERESYEMHKDFLDKVTAALNLAPNKNYFVNNLTGQVFERVLTDELRDKAEEEPDTPQDKIDVIQKLIHDAERRIGSYVVSQDSEDPYIQEKSRKIVAWMEQIAELQAKSKGGVEND